jgi:Flp pilus assembly protein TadD
MLDKFRARGINSARLASVYASIALDETKRLQAMERAVQIAPQDFAARESLAVEYMQRGRHDDADRQFQQMQSSGDLAPEQTAIRKRYVQALIDANEKIRRQQLAPVR